MPIAHLCLSDARPPCQGTGGDGAGAASVGGPQSPSHGKQGCSTDDEAPTHPEPRHVLDPGRRGAAGLRRAGGTAVIWDAVSGPHRAGAVAASGSEGTNALFSDVAAFGAVAGVSPWTTITAVPALIELTVVASM